MKIASPPGCAARSRGSGCEPRIGSKTLEPRVSVAEAVELDAHAVHDRQVHGAELAVVVALVDVVEHAAGLRACRPGRRPARPAACWSRAGCPTTCSR